MEGNWNGKRVSAKGKSVTTGTEISACKGKGKTRQKIMRIVTNLSYCWSEHYRARGEGSVPRALTYFFSGRGGQIAFLNT